MGRGRVAPTRICAGFLVLIGLFVAPPAMPEEQTSHDDSVHAPEYRRVGKVRIRTRTRTSNRRHRPDRSPTPKLGPEIPTLVDTDQLRERYKAYDYSTRPPEVGFAGIGPYAPRFGRFRETSFQDEVARALRLSDPNNLTQIDWNVIEIKRQGAVSGSERHGREQLDLRDGVELEVDQAVIEARRLLLLKDPSEIIAIDDIDIRRAESSLTADRLRIRQLPRPSLEEFYPLVPTVGDKPTPHVLVPAGYSPRTTQPSYRSFRIQGTNIDWHEKDLQIRAKYADFDSYRRRGTFEQFRGHSGPLYFGADSLRILGPADAEGTSLWVTTCDLPEPHYRIKVARSELESGDRFTASGGQVRVRETGTPIYVPRFSGALDGDTRFRKGTRLRLGRRSELGSYIDVAQWFRLNDSISLAPRVLVSRKENFGFGALGEYDFMEKPASPFYRSRGEFSTLYTTEDRGGTLWYHRQEFTPKTVMLGQWEQWYDEDYLKDFERDDFENRTGPRTFVNITHTEPRLIATATVSPSTTDFVRESEKRPEGSIHLLERPIGSQFYATFDGAAGYYSTNPNSIDSARVIGVGRISHDWNLKPGLNALSFLEADTTYYSDTALDGDDAVRLSATAGLTLQGRLQRTFPGFRGFSGFKHLVIPSTTLSYRPESTLDAEETPRFDDLDDRPGRLRIESTLDNVLLGRNASTGQIWPVARLALFHGNDLENETLKSNDYEIDMRIRPRPSWGVNTIAEFREIEESDVLPGEDFDRLLAFAFYDNLYGKNNLNARLGFALTEAGGESLNQEIIYGMGYKLTEQWSVAFEHRFDLNDGRLERQSYGIRRRLHKWEMGIRVQDRRSGFDVRFEINLTDFPNIGFGV